MNALNLNMPEGGTDWPGPLELGGKFAIPPELETGRKKGLSGSTLTHKGVRVRAYFSDAEGRKDVEGGFGRGNEGKLRIVCFGV